MFRTLITLALSLAGCASAPRNVKPVSNFSVDRYLGDWYELARLDHWFERGLTKVTATYSVRPDGGVRVVNRGYSAERGKWVQAEGRAYSAGSADEGLLKVSFFRPFYGSYVVFGLDSDQYQYAFVCGPSRKYLWLLSRTPTVGPQVRELFINRSEELGFNTSKLIFVSQE